jgi:nitroimidazol reductase NimA-like FMN-containing flavoprotein (pyridoxamine 5'-phosphate oxidase superfamily)
LHATPIKGSAAMPELSCPPKRVLDMLGSQHFCVLATSAGDRPHCSLMAYALEAETLEIIMVTHKASRKYFNLMANPNVSLLVDNRSEARDGVATWALTVYGQGREVREPAACARLKTALLTSRPELAVFFEKPEAGLIAIRMRTLLLLDGLTEAQLIELE